jgi:release factor glutamine methyltransferase
MSDSADAPWTVLRLLNWTSEYFARADVHEPRLAAEVLLAHVLACERIDLYARFGRIPDEDQRAEFRRLVARARAHEPVAYLVGRRDFYSMRLKVTPDVLVPRPESELLVAEAIGYLHSLGRPGRMWDVCTGCGCVAVATASHVPDVRVLATDISPPAVAVAAENAEAYGLTDRVRCRTADLLTLPDDCGDWRTVDVISANPPYVALAEEIAQEVEHEPELALYAGKTGYEVIRRLVRQAPAFLPAGGAFLMEFGMGQADTVRDLMADSEEFDEPRIVNDHQDLERTAVAIRL